MLPLIALLQRTGMAFEPVMGEPLVRTVFRSLGDPSLFHSTLPLLLLIYPETTRGFCQCLGSASKEALLS
jgi:hypothetical protein